MMLIPRRSLCIFVCLFNMMLFGVSSEVQADDAVRVKNFARIDGVRENPLVGYGLVVGLAGSGDTPRSKSTRQSIANALNAFGINVDVEDISSRNVAAVMVTATMSPFSANGDTIDVDVSSIGDARNLVGGTLLMTPLKGADGKVYAIAQGQVTVGGYRYDFNGNSVEKNHPTVGVVSSGGRIERTVDPEYVTPDNKIAIILDDPNFITATKLEKALNAQFPPDTAVAVNAGKIMASIPDGFTPVEFIAAVQDIQLELDVVSRVIVNERTGTVVSGGDIKIDNVTVSHGNLQVTISTEYSASQPWAASISPSVSTVVIPNSKINVEENAASSITLPSGSSIDDLIKALAQVKTSTRDVIGVLQAVKRAGALHADLIIQ